MIPILFVGGTLIIWHGVSGLKKGEITGKFGVKRTGKQAKIYSWMRISLGAVFVLIALVDLIMRLVSGF